MDINGVGTREGRDKRKGLGSTGNQFNVFKMRDQVLMFTKADNSTWTGDVWLICLPESMVRGMELMSSK